MLAIESDVAELEDDGDDFLEMDSFSETEKPVANRCCELLLLAMESIKASDAVMIKVNALSLCHNVIAQISEIDPILLADITPSASADTISTRVQTAAADIHRHIVSVSDCCTNLGCSLYPPLDIDELSAQHKAVITAVSELMRLDQEWEHAIDNAGREYLRSVILKLQQQNDVPLTIEEQYRNKYNWKNCIRRRSCYSL